MSFKATRCETCEKHPDFCECCEVCRQMQPDCECEFNARMGELVLETHPYLVRAGAR